jgi:DNA modification methylase
MVGSLLEVQTANIGLVEAEYIIKNLTVEHQLVVDPFMGIGTTGIAALKLNRKFIGIEINEATYNIARNRINVKTH